MDFSVIRSSQGLVPPAGLTPTGALDLSVIDSLPVLRCNAQTLHVFRHGPGAATVIREALSKALVPYYPLAGRLQYSNQGQQLQVACSGEGAWFVEASANCTLNAVNDFDDVTSIPIDKLLPDHPPVSEVPDPLVLMQVTEFACDGFVMGLVFCHAICDGLGAAQFLNAVGEMARGFEHLSIAPLWYRDFLSPPPQTTAACANSMLNLPLPPPLLPAYSLEYAKIDIPIDEINQLKQNFKELTGRHCSVFEVATAKLWRRRSRAINLKNDKEVKLVFFANCRELLQPPIPKGFYGNGFFPVTITASSERITGASNAEVVKMIQEAKAGLANEFEKWRKGELGIHQPFAPPLVYTTLFVSEWGRLGFNQVDHGWGPPIHIVPIQGSTIIPVAIIGSMPRPKKGIRLMTWCVQQSHLPPFLHPSIG